MKICMLSATLLILAVLMLVGIEVVYSENFLFAPRGGESIKLTNMHYAVMVVLTCLTVVLTGVLAWVAWYQLKNINESAKKDFLLNLESKYYSPENIRARCIIHNYYTISRDNYRNNFVFDSKELHDKIIEDIRKEIANLGRDKSPDKAHDFICLVSLLEYFESYSYFANNKCTNLIDIEEISGFTLRFFYEVFEDWIAYRRKKYTKIYPESNSYFSEFEKLIKALDKQRNSKS